MASATTDWLTAIGGLVAAVFTAVAAFAAWKAASASERTSREAREALVAAVEPHVLIEPQGLASGEGDREWRAVMRVISLERLPISDLVLIATRSDRHRVERKREVLKAFGANDDDDWWPDLWPMTEEWPPTTKPGAAVTFTLRYTDSRGLARYEQSGTARFWQEGGVINADLDGLTERRVK